MAPLCGIPGRSFAFSSPRNCGTLGRCRIHAAILAYLVVAAAGQARAAEPIDRRAVVERHHPTVATFDRESPFSVGNGQFAFTADVTGLQTFADEYDDTIPLCTLSNWGWHSFPNPDEWTI